MLYITKEAAEIFEMFFKQTGGQDWSDAGKHSYSRTLWRNHIVFRQPLHDGAFNIGGQGIEELSELWQELLKELNESEGDNE